MDEDSQHRDVGHPQLLRQPPRLRLPSGAVAGNDDHAVEGLHRLHVVRVTYHVDEWQQRALLVPVRDDPPRDVWDEGKLVDAEQLAWDKQPDPRGEFAPLPSSLATARSYKSWNTALKAYLYRTQTVTVYRCPGLKEYSAAGETEGEFRVRLTQKAKEQRDLDLEKLRKQYASQLDSLQGKLRTARQKVEREKSQFQTKTVQSAISLGTSVLGALFGRKLLSSTNVSRAGTAMRSVSRAADERADIQQAEKSVEELEAEWKELERKFQEQVAEVERETHPDRLELEELQVRPRKSDISIEQVALAWTPWRVDDAGIAEPAWDASPAPTP